MSKVMTRMETLDYLLDKESKKERMIITRYNDGEYLLMNGTARVIAKTKSGEISELLKKSIKAKDQFICVNYLKEHNIVKKDHWYQTQKYLIEESQNELYGCSNYNTYDFYTDSVLIPKHFSGRVLLVTGLEKESKEFFKDIQPLLHVYETPKQNAVEKYEEIKNSLISICKNYDNIVFSCGPLAKILVVDLIDKCECNLIDFGSVLNALLNLTNEWTMSWTKSVDMNQKRLNFINKLMLESK